VLLSNSIFPRISSERTLILPVLKIVLHDANRHFPQPWNKFHNLRMTQYFQHQNHFDKCFMLSKIVNKQEISIEIFFKWSLSLLSFSRLISLAPWVFFSGKFSLVGFCCCCKDLHNYWTWAQNDQFQIMLSGSQFKQHRQIITFWVLSFRKHEVFLERLILFH